jgi:hypothetical protein
MSSNMDSSVIIYFRSYFQNRPKMWGGKTDRKQIKERNISRRSYITGIWWEMIRMNRYLSETLPPWFNWGWRMGNKEYGPMEKGWKQEDYLKFRQSLVCTTDHCTVRQIWSLTFIHLGFYTWAQEYVCFKNMPLYCMVNMFSM